MRKGTPPGGPFRYVFLANLVSNFVYEFRLPVDEIRIRNRRRNSLGFISEMGRIASTGAGGPGDEIRYVLLAKSTKSCRAVCRGKSANSLGFISVINEM